MSWLPFYHDMGLVLGVCAPIMAGFGAVLTSPVAFLQRPARWLQLMARGGESFGARRSRRHPTSPSSWRRQNLGRRPGRVRPRRHRDHPQRQRAGTIRRPSSASASGLRASIFRNRCSGPRMGSRKQRCTWRRALLANHPRSSTSTPTNCPPGTRSGAQARAVHRWSVTKCRESPTVRDRRSRHLHRVPDGNGRRDLGARRQRGRRLLEQARGDRAHLRRKARRRVGRHTRGALAEDWRFGLHFRRRTVHHRPHQRPADRSRAQPLSRRHRGDDPRDHQGSMRGDIGPR